MTPTRLLVLLGLLGAAEVTVARSPRHPAAPAPRTTTTSTATTSTTTTSTTTRPRAVTRELPTSTTIAPSPTLTEPDGPLTTTTVSTSTSTSFPRRCGRRILDETGPRCVAFNRSLDDPPEGYPTGLTCVPWYAWVC